MCIFLGFLYIFVDAVQTVPKRPLTPPGRAQDAPRRPQDAPRRPPEGPKTPPNPPPDAPRRTPKGRKTRPRGAKTPQIPPRTRPDAPPDPPKPPGPPKFSIWGRFGDRFRQDFGTNFAFENGLEDEGTQVSQGRYGYDFGLNWVRSGAMLSSLVSPHSKPTASPAICCRRGL